MKPLFQSTRSRRIIDTVAAVLIASGLVYTLNQVWDSLSPYAPLVTYFPVSLEPISSEVMAIAADPIKLGHLAAAEEKYSEATIYGTLNDYNKGRKAFADAAHESELSVGQLTSCTYLFANAQARFEKESEHYDEATRLYSGLASTWKGAAIPCNYIDSRDNIAECSLLQNKMEVAQAIYEENVALAEHLDARPISDRPLERRLTLCGLMRLYIQQKNHLKMAAIAPKFVDLAKESGNRKSDVVEALINVAKARIWIADQSDYSGVMQPLEEDFKRDPLNTETPYYLMYTCIKAKQNSGTLGWFAWWINCLILAVLLPSFLGITRVRPAAKQALETRMKNENRH